MAAASADQLVDHFTYYSGLLEDAIRNGLLLSDESMLQFYGYYKQATLGDCDIPSPSFLQFRAKAKWNAWNNLRGMPKENAAALYVKMAVDLDLLT